MKKIILFLTVLGFFLSNNANAGSIRGWGYCFNCSPILATIELRGAGKADGDLVKITITPTNIEYICKNPGNPGGYFVDGTPGQFEFKQAEPIDGGNAVQKNGKVTVNVHIDVENQLLLVSNPKDPEGPLIPIPDVGTSESFDPDEYPDALCPEGSCVTLYDTLECVNPNWTVLRDSVVPSAMGTLAEWLDADGITVNDSVSAGCILDPVERYPEGYTDGDDDLSLLPHPNQIYDCTEDLE